ncbi:MAG: type II toxin-antitoxin system RelE/ParE family toxin [Capsulimonas sp.]|uniref:type II toxin-antitoxin system RelE/ParE family toxin n=1 Tax=Capsulimonas sp. TaxID=2494211 RepID=UPI0032666577
MTLVLRIAEAAKEDQAEIWRYIAADNELAADRMIDLFVDAFTLLIAMPGVGRMRGELGDGLYSYTVTPYLIFYRTSSTHMDILRVLHGSRDLHVLLQHDN